ncbi:hypothetical protein DRN72_01350 [Methanosarcinales archaeon]|nr:MAG: hypothetical protein DRN72_01350 [Methanosarcinales archaeon]
MLNVNRIWIVIMMFTILGCVGGGGNMVNAKVVMVIAPHDFRDEELFVPKNILEENGVDVVVASTQKKEAVGMLGAKITPDIMISEIDPNEFDAIVIVGGIGSREYLWNNTELHEIIREFYKQNKTIAAICISPVVLAHAGVLDQMNATVFPDTECIVEIERCGATYVREPVVVSDNIITADGPKSAEAFGREILKSLK